MKPRLIYHPLFGESEIKDMLRDIATRVDGENYDSLIAAARYIDKLEHLTVMFAKCMNDIDPQFVKIVEDNFWELLA